MRSKRKLSPLSKRAPEVSVDEAVQGSGPDWRGSWESIRGRCGKQSPRMQSGWLGSCLRPRTIRRR